MGRRVAWVTLGDAGLQLQLTIVSDPDVVRDQSERDGVTVPGITLRVRSYKWSAWHHVHRGRVLLDSTD